MSRRGKGKIGRKGRRPIIQSRERLRHRHRHTGIFHMRGMERDERESGETEGGNEKDEDRVRRETGTLHKQLGREVAGEK